MVSFIFTRTDDGSVGLFNQEINDIYHAKQGAYQEACDKFTLPAIEHLKQVQNNEILKVSDICYGIGYNTISFIEKLSKDKVINNYSKIKINAFELDEELIILSPFIKSTNYNWIIRLKLLKSIKKHFLNDKIEQTTDKYCDYINKAIYKRFKGELRFVRLLYNININNQINPSNFLSNTNNIISNLSNQNNHNLHFHNRQSCVFQPTEEQ